MFSKLFGKKVERTEKVDVHETYRIKITCGNCHNEKHIYVRKGTTASDAAKKEICANCDCKSFYVSYIQN